MILTRRTDAGAGSQGPGEALTRPPGEPTELLKFPSRERRRLPGRVKTRNRLALSPEPATGTTHGADPRAPLPHQGGRRLKRASRRYRVVEQRRFSGWGRGLALGADARITLGKRAKSRGEGFHGGDRGAGRGAAAQWAILHPALLPGPVR